MPGSAGNALSCSVPSELTLALRQRWRRWGLRALARWERCLVQAQGKDPIFAFLPFCDDRIAYFMLHEWLVGAEYDFQIH